MSLEIDINILRTYARGTQAVHVFIVSINFNFRVQV